MTLLRRPGAALATLLMLLIGVAFLTQVVPYRQIVESRQQVAAARAELAALEDANAKLEADVAALHTEAEIETLAREKLGYVRPGETAYIVLDPPGAEEAPVEDTPEPEEERTWVEGIWDFLTGADMDG
ncbi:MAG: septum formation initiator family protein [Actinobacteria bacterium]|nr:septum formation initiator family protein [Actinomycetota bacterium]MCI0543504.1 septum formation initiator family protein [Actinomycetota bacterium]MCI0678408.1 septum formation initiator family protein [Actinomycetota bacterium]